MHRVCVLSRSSFCLPIYSRSQPPDREFPSEKSHKLGRSLQRACQRTPLHYDAGVHGSRDERKCAGTLADEEAGKKLHPQLPYDQRYATDWTFTLTRFCLLTEYIPA